MPTFTIFDDSSFSMALNMVKYPHGRTSRGLNRWCQGRLSLLGTNYWTLKAFTGFTGKIAGSFLGFLHHHQFSEN